MVLEDKLQWANGQNMYKSLSFKDFIKLYKEERNLYKNDKKRIVIAEYRFRSFAYYGNVSKIMQIYLKIISKLMKIRGYIRIQQNMIGTTAQIGFGCMMVHPYGVIISNHSIIGNNSRIFQQVTVGGADGHDGAPDIAAKIGENVLLGSGAKVIGDIKIGKNVKVGANAVISKDVADDCTVIGINEIISKN